jgi:molecular chaperone DnaJ
MASSNLYEKDLYKVLGVSKTASAAEIKKKYRTLARELHPDKTKGDKKLEEKFKEVSESYEILSDEKKRKEYDEQRELFNSGRMPNGGFAGGGFSGSGSYQSGNQDFSQFFGGGGNPQDIFANLFGGGARGPRRGPDLETESVITFRESVHGKELHLTVRARNGNSRKVATKLPAGIKDGSRIRVAGGGGEGDGGNGDLYVTIHVTPHPIFGRENLNLTVEIPVSFAEAALGANIKIPTLEGEEVTLKLPAGSQSGKILKVKGRGIKSSKGHGDLLVKILVQTPQRINNEAKAFLESFDKALGTTDLRSEVLQRAKE